MISSPILLRRILAYVDYDTTVACFMSSKKISNMMMHPSVWERVRVPCDSPRCADALDFTYLMRAIRVDLEASTTDAIESVLSQLIENGAHKHLEVVAIYVDLMEGDHHVMQLLAQFPVLDDLVIQCKQSKSACVVFPETHGFKRLERLHVETGKEDKLEVYFDQATLPCLNTVYLDVHTSDIMAHAWRLNSNIDICFWNTGETFEDMNMDGARIRSMRLYVDSALALKFVISSISRAERIDNMVLWLSASATQEEIVFDTYLPVKYLSVDPYEGRRPKITCYHSAFKHVRTLTIDKMHKDNLEGTGTVRFVGWESFTEFQTWSISSLSVGPQFVVEVEP